MQSLTTHPILSAIVGGALIGLSAAMMLLFNGRITGLSGIIYGGIVTPTSENKWRWSFLIGLIAGGLILFVTQPEVFSNTLATPTSILIIGGLLVGFGTRLGGGCTSGHGVCGVSRLSKRSIVATCVFLAVGMMVATLVAKLGLR